MIRLCISIILCLHLAMPLVAMAQTTVKSPISYSLQESGFVLGTAILGGLAAWWMRVSKGELAMWSVSALIGELCVSAFAGLIAFWLCEYMNLNPLLTSAVVGMSGHAGAKGLLWLESIGRIYAFMAYWLSTVGGIEDQTTEMIAKDTANYIVNTGFQIRNNTTGPTVPLLITGGNIDPATGVATDILDTSGGSIFVNSSIVVPYSSGAEATIAIVQAGLSAQGFTTPVATRIDAAISSRATAGDIFAAT